MLTGIPGFAIVEAGAPGVTKSAASGHAANDPGQYGTLLPDAAV